MNVDKCANRNHLRIRLNGAKIARALVFATPTPRALLPDLEGCLVGKAGPTSARVVDHGIKGMTLESDGCRYPWQETINRVKEEPGAVVCLVEQVKGDIVQVKRLGEFLPKLAHIAAVNFNGDRLCLVHEPRRVHELESRAVPAWRGKPPGPGR